MDRVDSIMALGRLAGFSAVEAARIALACDDAKADGHELTGDEVERIIAEVTGRETGGGDEPHV